MNRILFLDDHYLHVVRDAKRCVGRAELLKDTLYGDPNPDIFTNIPNVFFSEPLGKWLMITYGTHLREFYDVILIHESEDALHWRPMDTRAALPMRSRKFPNQLFELGECGEFCAFVDAFAPEEERYKLLAVRKTDAKRLESCLFTSHDGLHWTDRRVQWHVSPPDLGPLSIFWNAQRECYAIATRPSMVDRRISLIETVDWKHFSKPEVILETDALDSPVCESYGITVLPYDNYYLGLYWLFHPNAQQVVATPGGVSGKYFDGYVDAQITSSTNGRYFKRTLREPVLPNGAPGSPDCGCIYPRGMRRAPNGEILIDACVYPFEHGRWRNFAQSSERHLTIATYRIREDGFCYYRNIGGNAFLGTRALHYGGGEITWNVQCPTGEFSVQVTDERGRTIEGYSFEECSAFHGDSTAWSPRWAGGRTLLPLAGRTIRFEMLLKTGSLYGIHGSLSPVFQPE